MALKVEESTYKDSPVITFKKDDLDRYPFSFGLVKAKIILDHIDIIRAFVEKHDKAKNTPP